MSFAECGVQRLDPQYFSYLKSNSPSLPNLKTSRKQSGRFSISNCLELCTPNLHLLEPQSPKASRGSFMLTLTPHNTKGPL